MSTNILKSPTILYEDNHLIAAVKPVGILSQPDKSGDSSILEQVKQYIKEKHNKPGNVFLGLLHRLDRPVSGIMLFAKTSKGASRLSEQFRNHEVRKTYHALVHGLPKEKKGRLVNLLGKDVKLLKGKEYDDGQEAVLHYEVEKSTVRYSLLRITIETGMFHQIRTQLSLAGFPIVGDVKYGSKEAMPNQALALCATGLSFKKATEDEIVDLKIEIPEEWKKYL